MALHGSFFSQEKRTTRITKNDTNSSIVCSLSGATFTLSGGSRYHPRLPQEHPEPQHQFETIPSAGGIDDILALAPKILIGLVFLVAGILPFVL